MPLELVDMSAPAMLCPPETGPGSRIFLERVDAEADARAERLGIVCYCSGDHDCPQDYRYERLWEKVFDEFEAAWEAEHA